LPDADIHWYVEKWDMQGMPDAFGYAKAWAELCARETWYAYAFKVPFVFGGSPGILLLESSAASTRKYKENMELFNAGGIITDPYWLYFTSSFFPYLSFLNFHGMTDGQGSCITLAPLGVLLDGALGHNTWRQEYCTVTVGYYLENFRRMLCEVCEAKHWAEIVIGRSQAKYACLDAYVKVVSHGEAIGEDEAWYILGASIPVALRTWFPRPDLWYSFHDWLSYGQRASPAEWIIEYGLDPKILERIADAPLPIGYPAELGTMNSIHSARIRTLYDQWRRKHYDRALAKAKAMAKYVRPPGIRDALSAPRSKH
jgi:hypothetical protein